MSIYYELLGRNLRKFRKRRGISLEAFAQIVGLTPSHYGNIERGSRRAQLELLERACLASDIWYEELLSGATHAHIAAEGEEKATEKQTDEAKTSLQIVKGCSSRTITYILEACRCMASIEKTEKP